MTGSEWAARLREAMVASGLLFMRVILSGFDVENHPDESTHEAAHKTAKPVGDGMRRDALRQSEDKVVKEKTHEEPHGSAHDSIYDCTSHVLEVSV